MNAIYVIRRNIIVFSVLTVAAISAALFAVLLIPPTYDADGSFVVRYPAISGSPDVTRSAAQNPLLRYTDTTTVPQTIEARVSGDSVRHVLVSEGQSGDYTLSTSTELNNSAQIIYVTVTAQTAKGAIAGVNAVGAAMSSQLALIQREAGATSPALITVAAAGIPLTPATSYTSAIRTVVGVLGIGAILIVVVLSLLERRRFRRHAIRA